MIPNVGTKILIVNTQNGCLGCLGEIGVVTEKINTDGLLENDPGYNVELENGRIWRINLDATVTIVERPWSKDLLKDGLVVKRRDGNFSLVIGDVILRNKGFITLNEYTDDLRQKHSSASEFDIVAIYQPIHPLELSDLFNELKLKLLWERPAEVREMTLSQISKELGCEVKIIEEEK